ncbi:DUF2510 domain-containing protein [Arenivirga flava]|uniref:DUF2510 domain-containing protein n=1 Tax=Arenivirga flava TaxID=1930060 RepID=A0AA37XCE2_9MICO|nr:DUF2510 domain-containing protein [Arenivirga flava]GMA29698.1 hypothetical protein GCM10025874_29510 [Arenivirga flava]
MTQAAPGWYDDGTGRLRWWDGAAWSGDVLDPAPADPIRSLRVERHDDDVDPVVAWARQQAAAQEAAAPVATPDSAALRARPRRRALPWVLGGLLGAIVLAGAGGAVLAMSGAVGDPVDPGAASVVDAYNELWAGGACETAGSVGTAAFIADLGWDDCALLADSQRSFLQSYEDYRVTVDETSVQGELAWVDTSERYRVPGDEEERIDTYRYELVCEGDAWLIDSISAR